MAVQPQAAYLTAALICASVGSFHDLRSRRIPNLLTGPAIVFGVLLHGWFGGLPQFGLSALAGLIAGGLFLLFFVAGGMGAGDVKLMTAVGCLAGITNVQQVLLSTVLIGAVMAIAFALYRGRLRETISNVRMLIRHHNAKGLTAHPEIHVGNAETLRLPYALPIAAGCVVTFLLASTKEFTR